MIEMKIIITMTVVIRTIIINDMIFAINMTNIIRITTSLIKLRNNSPLFVIIIRFFTGSILVIVVMSN